MNLQFEKEGIDTLKIARKFFAPDKKKGLDHLCAHYGIKNENRHRAYGDAVAADHLYRHMKREFGEMEPEVFLPRPLLYSSRKENPITKRQIEYLEKFAQYHQIFLPMDIKKLTRNEASRFADQLIAKYGKI